MTTKHPDKGSLGSEAIERSPGEGQVPPRPPRGVLLDTNCSGRHPHDERCAEPSGPCSTVGVDPEGLGRSISLVPRPHAGSLDDAGSPSGPPDWEGQELPERAYRPPNVLPHDEDMASSSYALKAQSDAFLAGMRGARQRGLGSHAADTHRTRTVTLDDPEHGVEVLLPETVMIHDLRHATLSRWPLKGDPPSASIRGRGSIAARGLRQLVRSTPQALVRDSRVKSARTTGASVDPGHSCSGLRPAHDRAPSPHAVRSPPNRACHTSCTSPHGTSLLSFLSHLLYPHPSRHFRRGRQPGTASESPAGARG